MESRKARLFSSSRNLNRRLDSYYYHEVMKTGALLFLVPPAYSTRYYCYCNSPLLLSAGLTPPVAVPGYPCTGTLYKSTIKREPLYFILYTRTRVRPVYDPAYDIPAALARFREESHGALPPTEEWGGSSISLYLFFHTVTHTVKKNQNPYPKPKKQNPPRHTSATPSLSCSNIRIRTGNDRTPPPRRSAPRGSNRAQRPPVLSLGVAELQLLAVELLEREAL
jgi:hypothetical protein